MSHWKLLEIHHPTRDASAPACDACGEHHDLHYLAIDKDGDQYNLGGACAVACGVVDSVVHDELSEAAKHHHALPDGWDKDIAGDDLHAMVREFQPVGHGFDEGSDWRGVEKYAKRPKAAGIYTRDDLLRLEIEKAAEETEAPSEAQAEAGNYRKGKVRLHGLTVSIENAKGSKRRPEWPPLSAHYGYINRTIGKDGDHVDCYIGDQPESEIVFVIDQQTAGGRFDEHKCVFGCVTEDEAKSLYLANYPPDWRCGFITAMTTSQFKAWLDDEDGDTTKPVGEQVSRYARRKQLASTPGQRSLFQESGSDGRHVIWKEHLHPRDEGGKFAKRGQDRIPSSPGQQMLVEGPEGSGFVPPVQPPSTSKKHQPRLANFDELFLNAWHGGAGKSDADFLAELKAERAGRVESEQPAGKEPWQLTYGDLRNALNPSTREELQAARPLLAAMYPPDDDRITATEGDDPWGIHRAITKGDETPRVPMHDLSFRHKAAIRKAIAEGKSVPAEVLADYDEFKQQKNVQAGRLPTDEPQGSVSGDASEPARPARDPNGTPASVGRQQEPQPPAVASEKATEFQLERGKVAAGRPDPVPDDTKEKQGLLLDEMHDLPGQKRFFGGEEERAKEADTEQQPSQSSEATRQGDYAGAAPAAADDYEAAKRQRDTLEDERRKAAESLKAVPGVGSGEMGKTPDSVRATKEYKEAKAKSDSAFKKLQDFNAGFVKKFKDEIAGDRSGSRPSVTPTGARRATPEGMAKIEAAKQKAREAVNATYDSPRERADAIVAAREAVAVAQAEAHSGKPYVEPTAEELAGESAPADKPYTLATAEQHYDAIRSGKATAAQAKEWFEQWDKSRESLTAELSKKTVAELKKMGAGGYNAAGMKKDQLVKSAVDMIGEQYHVGDSLRWSPFSEKKEDALRRAVGGQTDEHFKAFADKVAKAMDERKEKIAGYVKAMKEPETLEEFREHVRVNGIGKLSDEQLAKYDDMAAADRRARDAASKSTVTGFRPGAQATGEVGIVEGHHQKRNAPTWMVTVAEHLGDNWSEALSRAKRLGGSYVNARIAKAYGATPGFQFFSKEAAEQMQEVLGGKSVDQSGALAESKLASIENAADRLAALAASTHESADAALNADRKTNTHKRAEQAAYADSRARSQKALAETMERLSAAMKEGGAKHLEGIRNRAHVEELNWQLRRARDAKLKADGAHNKPYDEYEALRDAPASADDVKHAAYPYPAIWASQLQKHAEAFAEEPGLMRLAQRLQKTAAGAGPQFKKQGGGMKFSGGNILYPKETTQLQNLHVPEGKGIRVHQSHDWRLAQKSDKKGPFYTADGGKSFGTTPEIAVSAALSRGNAIDLVDRPEDKLLTISDSSEIATLSAAVKKLRRSGNRDLKRVGEELHSRLESYNRLQAMDIKSPVELRAAMRDYLPLRTKPQGEDKIKKLERGLVGKKIEGFFPTPRPLIERMIDAAGIEPGHEVLEPSAGKGDILDAIRERHPDARTAGIEPHSDLRGIIEAKGHSLVDRDFTQHAGQYDRIVMNPPFERGQDAEHVRHAYERLKPGGRLVAITSAGPFQRSDKKSEAFRQWLDTVGGTYEDLPEGSFAGSDSFRQTGVNTKLVIVDKPE